MTTDASPRGPADFGGGIRRFFAPDGLLAAALPGYEERPEQREMALNVAAAIERGDSLVAEAGTGTGKTLAYLVPALASGLKVVVSTGTKALQEQLIEKDVPLLELAAERRFDVVVLKGRSNYLCENRFELASAQLALPGFSGRNELVQIRDWRETTETGDRAELSRLPDNANIWSELTVSSDQCTGRRCEQYERCWVTKVRRRAVEAQLLIVNHHLYFADAALRQRVADTTVSILPAHDLVIFDEAHEVEEIAAQYFGFHVSELRLQELARDTLRACSSQAELHARMRKYTSALERSTQAFFDLLPFANGRERISKASVSPSIGAYHELDTKLDNLEAQIATLEAEEAAGLKRRAATLAAELAFVLYQPDRRSTLTEVALDLGEEADAEHDQRTTEEFSSDARSASRVPFVRYTETSGRNRALVARPLEIAPLMQKALGSLPAVFTSATLAVDGDFEHFRRRIGLPLLQEFIADSPFDYQTQARLYLPEDLPTVDNPNFANAAAARIVELVNASGGGAFILCTSNRMVEQLSRRLHQQTSLTVLSQGSAPRGRLIERFRQDGDAVLVATMSFWRGIDVPGRALRLVVIDRLPFASPSDPMVAARVDYLKRIGQSPFRTYQVPQATLLLRQGFGRLVRSRNDKGLVAILDGRITKKSYGRLFMRSLPATPVLRDKDAARAYLAAISD